MGVMTTLVMNYTINPLAGFFSAIFRGLHHSMLVAGHARAASELARQGYHEAAKQVMLELDALREKK